MNGEAALWGVTDYLLAAAVDALNAANWQRAGDKKAHRPKPLPRPVPPRRLTPDQEARLRDFRRRHAMTREGEVAE